MMPLVNWLSWSVIPVLATLSILRCHQGGWAPLPQELQGYRLITHVPCVKLLFALY